MTDHLANTNMCSWEGPYLWTAAADVSVLLENKPTIYGLMWHGPREISCTLCHTLSIKWKCVRPNSPLWLKQVTIHICLKASFVNLGQCVLMIKNTWEVVLIILDISLLCIYHSIICILEIIGKAWCWLSLIYESYWTTKTFLFYQ